MSVFSYHTVPEPRVCKACQIIADISYCITTFVVQFLAMPCGLIRGALAALGYAATVHADVVNIPACMCEFMLGEWKTRYSWKNFSMPNLNDSPLTSQVLFKYERRKWMWRGSLRHLLLLVFTASVDWACVHIAGAGQPHIKGNTA